MADYFPIVRCLEKDPWEWGWDALVAIGTIGLAAVTVWISIRTDRKIDARIKDRERRDAIPLATAIQQEMQEIMAFSYKAKAMMKALPNHEIVCEQIVKQRAQLLPLTLIENIASLGCFDAGTGKAVAGALTMARILNSTLDVDDDFARRAHKKVLDSLLDLAERFRPAFHDADEKLSAYTGIPAKKRGVPPLGIEI